MMQEKTYANNILKYKTMTMEQKQINQDVLNELFEKTRVPRTSEKMEGVQIMIEDAFEDNQSLWQTARDICLFLGITPIRNRAIIYDIINKNL